MKHYFRILLILLCSSLMFSCSDDEHIVKEYNPDKTIVVFFPYTRNLTGYLKKNIRDIETAILNNSNNPRVIVYMNENESDSYIYTMTKYGNTCLYDTLRSYKNKDYSSSESLSNIFKEIKSLAPNTKEYSLIVGCHGMGWIYADDYYQGDGQRPYYMNKYYSDRPITRWMGVPGKLIDVNMLSEAMSMASLHTNLLLFDACYMGNIETAYEMRNVTDYIVSSSTEIMAEGMPYTDLWSYISNGSESALDNLCERYYSFYQKSSSPYATISLVKTSGLESLASCVKELNAKYEFDDINYEKLQYVDAYRPSIFFDMGRYVELQCNDAEALEKYKELYNNVVLSKYNTENYYTSASGEAPLKYFSGLTTSAPSQHLFVIKGWSKTAWYKATH